MSQKIITTLSGTQTTGAWSATVPQKITLLNTSNVRYPRNIILTANGVMISRGAYSVGVPIADILALCVAYEPFLSWPPVITVQPTAASCVHSSTAATFTVTATAEIAIAYQWQYNAKAFGTLTNDGNQPTNNSTIAIAGKTYTFQTTLTNVDGNVHIGASNTASMTNLFNAINATGGTPGTDYATLMTANASVVATNPTSTTVVVTAITGGTDGNSLATTQAGTSHCTWGGTTLASGGWTNASGTVNGCAYTNGTTATLTCTPTTVGQNTVQHKCIVTDGAGTTTTNSVVLTIT